jgi:hypothetical protein
MKMNVVGDGDDGKINAVHVLEENSASKVVKATILFSRRTILGPILIDADVVGWMDG